MALAGVAGGLALMDSVELPSPVEPAETTFVCASDVPNGACSYDRSIAQFSATENRVTLRYDEIPEVVIQAVVAAEDRDFFHHNGIDPFGIARALVRDLEGSGVQQGGSTITQQYVKVAFLTRERSLTRKLREAALSIKLERKLSKQEILGRYLNEVYFGRGAYGIEAASRAYFGIGAGDLDLAQAAYLVGLIRAPNLADAVKDPKEATRRRTTVLNAMVATGAITPAQAAAAKAVPWEGHVLASPPRVENVRVVPDFAAVGGSYIAEWVRTQLIKRFGEATTYTKGLRVYLTVNPSQQRDAFAAVTKTLDEPNDPAGALVAIDAQGRITAMVGGRDFNKSKVNFALGTAGGGSGRQPGSTFKAFALTAFVEKGYSIQSRFNAPPELVLPKADEGKDWTVSNFDDEDLGGLTVEKGTWLSSNTLYAQIMQQVGPQAVVDEAAKLGVTAPMKAVNSTVLGTSEVSVLDLTSAYSTLARRGVAIAPYVIRCVEAADGEVLYDAGQPKGNQVLPEPVADTVTTALRGVIKSGTGTAARLKGRDSAGKTGTTQEHRDAWFVGYTCHLTAAVWMGYDTPAPMENLHGVAKVTGGTLPARIWKAFMDKATAGSGKCTYPTADAGTTVLNGEFPLGTTTTTAAPVLPPVAPPGAVPGDSTAPAPAAPAPGASAPPVTAAGAGAAAPP